MPEEFDSDTAMGLAVNIPVVEAAQSLMMARAISIAMGDAKNLAACVYLTTGNDRLAQKVELDAVRQRGMNG
jgi:hypothetical protein